MIAPGAEVDRYLIEAEVGSGGHATVWLARHRTLGSLHAIKVLHRRDAELVERLSQEGRIQARLEHPNLVPVSDAVPLPSGVALVMPFVAGPTLAAWLANHRPTVAESVPIAAGVLAGLAYAHGRGIIHRDLKPANILLAPEENGGFVPRITDFGIAKDLLPAEGNPLTQTGQAVGTLAYMAPEQARSARDVDHRADLFSFGCILYELLAGVRAFPQPDLLGVITSAARGDFVPLSVHAPSVPESLAALVHQCLSPEPAARPADCAEVLARLGLSASSSGSRAAAVAVAPASTSPPSPVRRAPRISRRNGLLVGVGVAVASASVYAFVPMGPVGYPHAQGRVAHFDGKSAILVAPSESLNLAGPLTVEAWVWPEAWQFGDLFPVVDRVWRLEVTVRAVSFSSGNRTGTQLAQQVPLHRWTHLAVTYNPSLRSSRWYRDGVLAVEETYSEPLWDFTRNPPEPLAIGAGPYGRPEFAQGYLDDVRIWSRELSEAEVRASAAGRPVDTADLVGEWAFDGLGENPAADSSGNNNEGAVQGTVSFVPPDAVGVP